MMNQKSKGKPIKKVFAMLMAFAMMITLLPGQSISVLAAEEENTEETYTLTLDYSDGRDVTTINGLTEVPKLNPPEKEGYIFDGWSNSKDTRQNTLRTGDKLERDTTIYAVWKKVTDDRISYVLNYGGKSFKLTHVPWDYDKAKLKNFVIPDTVDDIPVTIVGMGSMDAVMNYIETLVFGNNVEEIQEICNRWGSTSVTSITFPNSLTSIDGAAFMNFKKITEVTLPAGIKAIYHNTFNGCTSLEKVRIEGALTQIGENAFENCSNLKYIYYGGTEAQWKSELKEEYDVDNCTHSFEFGRDWDRGTGTYEIEFGNEYFVVNFGKNINGWVDNRPKFVIAKKDTTISKPSDPYMSDFYKVEFEGWYKDKECTQKWDFATDTVTNDMTIYANWNSTEREVTFNYSGKRVDSTKTVTKGSTITEPYEPTVRGYELEGWYKDKECTQKWNFETDIVTKDMTLYAKWESTTKTVTFSCNGKTDDWTQKVTKGDKITEPYVSNVEGYRIEGWYKDAECTQKWDFSTDIVTDDTTLYANWESAERKVTFNYSGKSADSTETVVKGRRIAEPTEPDVEGYEIEGWYKDSAYTQKWNFATDTITEDMTLYAKWVERDSEVQGKSFKRFKIGDVLHAGDVIYFPAIPQETQDKGITCNKFHLLYYSTDPEKPNHYIHHGTDWVYKDQSEYQIPQKNDGSAFSFEIKEIVCNGRVYKTFKIEEKSIKSGLGGTKNYIYDMAVRPMEDDAYDYETPAHKIDTVEIRGIDAPAAGRELETTAVCNTEGISTKTPIVRWTPDVTIAGYNSSYTASVTISASEKFVFADNVTATVNGKTATGVTKNQDGTITVTYTFDATEKDKLISITAPQAITVANGTRYENMKLPKTVQIVTEGKTVTVADVIWDTSADNNYDPSKLTEQIVKLNGTVTCPDTIDSNQVPLTTSITVTVSAAGIIPEVPKITSQPENATIQEGETATFTVTAAGIDLTYQWRIDRNDGKGFVAIEAANQAFYTTSVADKSCNGFQYQCVVSNSAGTVTSDTAVLTVNEKKTQQSDDSEIQWQLLNRAKEITEKTLAEFQAKNGTKQADLADLVAQALKDNHIYSVISAVTAFQKTEPTEKAEGKINGIVTLSIGSYSAEVSFDYALAKTEQTNTTQKTEKIAGSGAQTSNGQVKISWNAMSEADGYQIYVSLCNGKNSYKMLKDTKTLNGTIKNLDNTKSYKFYVVAYKNVDGKKVRISKSMVYHVTLADGKYTNVKAIKVPKSTYTLDIGEKKKLTARSVKEDKTKKLLKHAQEFRYYSSDASIAVVSKNGEIKAKKPGSCIIYIVANNGVVKKVKVTVS
ncbi:MAG: InlB B-repeat-containing protein [Lachnobacterium sp.]|nr:InlB B-repeat-containing protein [Lachnobacterium sp.]